jgi:hypothetical protein
MERLKRDTHSSLLHKFINYGRKKFYKIMRRCQFNKKNIFFFTGDMQDKLVPGVFEPKVGLIFTGKARAHPSGPIVKIFLQTFVIR